MDQMKRFGGYDYAFSVIVAVYNVAPYIREAIDSLIHQTIGFENIQVILVDDGSTDESPKICDEYKEKYPDNIVVIHKPNGGVSSARNIGLEYARGQYYNFMDPDDKLSLNTMRDVFAFYQKHAGETDVVGIPMHFFEAEVKPHIQNFKFNNGTRVIDLLKEWAIPHASASSSFITAEMASKFKFDSRVTYGEDACFINKIMLHKGTLGMVASAKYHYRKRRRGDSAVQNSKNRKAWYLPSVHYFMEELLSYAQDLRGEVPLFTQYNVMYDMQWRLTQSEVPEGILTDEEIGEYRETVYRILSQLDDRVIYAQRFLATPYKYYAVRRNHTDEPITMWYNGKPLFTYGNQVVMSNSEISLVYTNVTVENGEGRLKGYLSIPVHAFEESKLFFDCESRRYPCVLEEQGADKMFLGDPVSMRYGFDCRIAITPNKSWCVKPTLCLKNGSSLTLSTRFDFAVPLVKAFKHSYAPIGNYYLVHRDSELTFKCYRLGYTIYKELCLIKELYQRGKRKAILVRQLSKLYKILKRKNNWLLCSGTDADEVAIHNLINTLHKEDPSARLYIAYEDDKDHPSKIDGATVVTIPKKSQKYNLFLLTLQRIYCKEKDWGTFNPLAKPDCPYRDLLTGIEVVVCNDDFEVVEQFPCDKVPRCFGRLLRSVAGTVKKILVNNAINRAIRKNVKALICKMPQKYILFESVPPYSDNTWAVYQYLCAHNMLKEYKLRWVLEKDETPRANIPSFVKKDTVLSRLHYKYIATRTKAFIYCNRTQQKVRADQLTINLGHGSCFKSVRGRYSMPKNLDYALIQAPAFEGATRYEHDFSDHTVIAALGYPRNDDFFEPVSLDRNMLFSQPFKKLLIWYPTYRQHKNGRNIASTITLPLIHDAESAEKINACAAEHGVLIVLKPHFAQDTSYIQKTNLSNLVFIDDTFFATHGIRPYQFLHMSDGLITDFSSVYYDYLLQNKPIALVWEDFEEYKESSGFAVDTNIYCAGGEKVYTVDELCAFITRIAKEQDLLHGVRTGVRDLTNAYCDGNNAQRTAQWVQHVIDTYPDIVEQ